MCGYVWRQSNAPEGNLQGDRRVCFFCFCFFFLEMPALKSEFFQMTVSGYSCDLIRPLDEGHTLILKLINCAIPTLWPRAQSSKALVLYCRMFAKKGLSKTNTVSRKSRLRDRGDKRLIWELSFLLELQCLYFLLVCFQISGILLSQSELDSSGIMN